MISHLRVLVVSDGPTIPPAHFYLQEVRRDWYYRLLLRRPLRTTSRPLRVEDVQSEPGDSHQWAVWGC